jgi:hypothetical protein
MKEYSERDLRIGSWRDVTLSFALSGIFCGRILSVQESEKVVMFLLIESMGQSREWSAEYLSLASSLLYYFTSFCTDYLVLSRR